MPAPDDRPDDADARAPGLAAPKIALILLLALLGWHAFRGEYGYVPLLGDIDLAIHRRDAEGRRDLYAALVAAAVPRRSSEE